MEAFASSCNGAAMSAQDQSPVRTRKRLARPVQTDSEALNDALGPEALRVLSFLLELRAVGEEVRPTRAGIGKRCGLDLYEVRMALARLSAAGLQHYLGRFIRQVASGKGLVIWDVDVRAVTAEYNQGVIQSTVEARAWAVEELARRERVAQRGWGGARRGAGRPRKVEDNLKAAEGDCIPMSTSQAPSELTPAAPSTSDQELRADFGIVGLVAKAAPDLRPKIVELGGRYIPQRPTLWDPPKDHVATRQLDKIWFVRTPPPPELPDEPDNERDVKILAEAFRQAVLIRYGINRQVARGDITRSKHFGLLAGAAAFMRREGISPICWALFSVDFWQENNDKIAPPVQFVFSHSRLVELIGLFRDREDTYTGGLAKACPELVQLFADHDDMWRALLREAPDTRPKVLEIVDRFFPGDAWERRFEGARQGQIRLQREIDQLVADGVCVWGV